MKKRLVITLFFLISILALFLRLIWLDRVPTAITNDELDYVFDAKAIFLQGRDVSGQWSPFSLTTPPFQVSKAELPALIISPLIGFLNFSLFSARLPYVILGIILLTILFLITRELFGDWPALIVLLVGAINPWSFYFSRAAFDTLLAVTLYLSAFYILIVLKGWKLLLAFPFFFLGFFSYLGTKVIFLPLVLLTSFYSWFFLNKKKYIRHYLVLIFLCLLTFFAFLISFKSQPVAERGREILTPFHSLVSQRVDQERRLSVVNPLVNTFSNKGVVFIKIFLEKYLGIFSPQFLFLHGEERSTYSVWYHGMFYYSDFIFLLLGFCYLFVKNRKFWLFLVFLLLVAPLPSALSVLGEEYALRGALLFPFLIFLTGLGFWFLISLKKNRFWQITTIAFLIIIYFFQLSNFLTIYFFRNPIYNSEGFGFSRRLLVSYLNYLKPENKRILVIGKEELALLKHFLFYSNLYSRENATLLSDKILKEDFSWDNIRFTNDCPEDIELDPNEVVILAADINCPSLEDNYLWLTIPQLGDGGTIFKIFNDPLCNQFVLNRYPSNISFEDLEVEKIGPQRFCQKFITDLTGYASFKKN